MVCLEARQYHYFKVKGSWQDKISHQHLFLGQAHNIKDVFPHQVVFPGGRLGQPIFGTLSITSFHPARLSADGINLTTKEVLNDSRDSVSTVNPRANSSFGFPTSDRWLESPGSNVLANAVQREQSTNSTARSSHVQV